MYISKEELETLFVYDEGKLINLYNRNYNSLIGKHAASLTNKGYYSVKIKGRSFREHRLIWNMLVGAIPEGMQVDHINGVRNDNRIDNLRLVTSRENSQNQRSATVASKTGVLGVSYYKKYNCYVAQISVNYKKINLGYFDNIDDAYVAYVDAKRKLHKTCTI